MTYAELAERALRMAGWLRERGVGHESRVAVCLPRGTAMVWATLGVLAAGAAYVPVDPRHPQERIDFCMADAEAAVMITTEVIEEVERLPAGRRLGAPVDVPGSAAAYVIYTSGSTGTPKGVLVEHRAAVDFSLNIATAYGIDTATRLLGFAALTFDLSVFELWAALTAGATLVLAGDEERMSVEALQRLMERSAVTVAELPPGLMPLLDPSRLPDLRLVSVGGEAPAGTLVDAWATPRREFWNGYGPAETTVAVTLMKCVPPSGGRVPPIGLPMPGHRCYVLDPHLRLVPPGVPGELCVAGPGLARGYLGRPGQTAERFTADPYSPDPGARLYRTGDLVRWSADGVLDFLGRVDRQVKIRGFRVEPGEVEAVLATDGRVAQVAVAPWDDHSGVRHLVAYVVPEAGQSAPDLAELRDLAASRLPDYMVPTRSVALDRLPLTASGKIDRQALPEPAEPDAGAAPQEGEWTDETERIVATEILAPLLDRKILGPDDDFFRLGGNSLQATQMTSRIRDRFDVEISLADFFAVPTARGTARMVAKARQRQSVQDSRLDEIGRQMRPGAVLPLSYPQLALHQAIAERGSTPGYHAPFSLRLRGPLDLEALRAAFQTLSDRHPPLRVTFEEGDDGPVQRVHERVTVPFTVADVPGDTSEERFATMRRLVREENERPFDLAAGPIIRVRVHRLGKDDHVVQWTIHHIVTDGWSVGLQLGEVGEAYHAYASGELPEPAPSGADYADFITWHRDYVASPAYRDDLDWWRGRLAGLPDDVRLPREPTRGNRSGGFLHGWRNVRLDGESADRAQGLAQRFGVTLYMATLAAYAVALAADAGADELVVVTPNALRVRSEWESLIGWFVNRVLIRLRIDDDLSFGEFLRQVRVVSLDAFAHQNVPFEMLRRDLRLPDSAVAVHFSLQNAPSGRMGFRDFEIDVVRDDTGRDFAPIMEVYSPLGTRFEASLTLRPRPGAIAGGVEYNAALFADEQALGWAAAFVAVLERAAAEPDTTLAEMRALALSAIRAAAPE
jgi:amino acid adenylation domain-containing protein